MSIYEKWQAIGYASYAECDVECKQLDGLSCGMKGLSAKPMAENKQAVCLLAVESSELTNDSLGTADLT